MQTPTRIDDCLETREGQLFIEQCKAVDLIEKFGSPLFVMSEDQIRRNVRRFIESFSRGWPDGPVKVMPAAKANWISAVQYVLASEGCGCDVYSAGELGVALAADFPHEFISVNGVPKNQEHIRRSIAEGVRLTIDAVEEVDMIEAAAKELGKKAAVRLRLKPPLSGFTDHSDFAADGPFPTDITALVYKGGLTFDLIREIAPRVKDSDQMELVGFHQHHGRHHPSTRYWEEQMRAYAKEMGRVCELLGGYHPSEIDIGGGFATHRDPFAAAVRFDIPLQLAAMHALSKLTGLLGPDPRYKVLDKLISATTMKPNDKPAPTIEQYAEATTSALKMALQENRIDPKGVTLELEPGRSLHGDAGIHLATVQSIKRATTPIRYNIIITDTTEFWLTGGVYEHNLHDFLFANKTDAPKVEKADINGRSCYGDRIIPLVEVPHVEVGDVLAMLDTGAYQEVSMSNFNALPRPATLLVRGDEAEVIRTAERQEDVYHRDIIPERLKASRNSVA